MGRIRLTEVLRKTNDAPLECERPEFKESLTASFTEDYLLSFWGEVFRFRGDHSAV